MSERLDSGPTDTYSRTWRAVGMTFANLLTDDAHFQRELERAKAAATTDVAVLLLGETGTGKTILAQAIHNASDRAEGPFVRTNCAKLPDTLIDTELFGHEKGSFTGADKLRRGAFERANLGTLFLDEIGDMVPNAQAKILHALEYREFHRVGGEQMIQTDVRYITATNAPLATAVQDGVFRADLYYRLAQCTIELPPLRTRKGDIPLYVEAFLEEANEKHRKRCGKLTRAARKLLQAHDWPGNVRELRSVVQSAVALCSGKSLDADDLNLVPQTVAEPEPTAARNSTVPSAEPRSSVAMPAGEDLSLDAMEAAHIQHVLDSCDGNKKRAAETLGVSRPTLDRKIKNYGLRVR